jgi:hypothetical protein
MLRLGTLIVLVAAGVLFWENMKLRKELAAAREEVVKAQAVQQQQVQAAAAVAAKQPPTWFEKRVSETPALDRRGKPAKAPSNLPGNLKGTALDQRPTR